MRRAGRRVARGQGERTLQWNRIRLRSETGLWKGVWSRIYLCEVWWTAQSFGVIPTSDTSFGVLGSGVSEKTLTPALVDRRSPGSWVINDSLQQVRARFGLFIAMTRQLNREVLMLAEIDLSLKRSAISGKNGFRPGFMGIHLGIRIL